MVREFLYVTCFLFWAADKKKVEDSVIYCKNCKYPVTYFYTYGFYASAADDKVVNKLKQLMRTGSSESVVKYLLHLHNEKQTVCPKCGQYAEWYNSHVDPQKLGGLES